MKRPQITPGDWHVGINPGPIVYGAQGEQITAWNVMLEDTENRANCRAIAALPKLLTVLEKRWRALQGEPITPGRDNENRELREALIAAGYEF